MKKYLSIATLIAAGTLFAGAATLEEGKNFDPAKTYTTDGNTFSFVLTFDVDMLRTYLQTGASAVKHELVSFDITNSNNSTTTKIGVTTNYSSSSGKITSSGLYYIWGINYAWNSAVISGDTNLATISWDNVLGAAMTYTFSSNAGTTVAFNLVDASGNDICSFYDAQSNLKSNQVKTAMVTFDTAVSKGVYFNSVLSADDAKTFAHQAAAAAVPEPSAFGLLAGLGALALVGARRRRVK